ncbi:MAG TPA: Flp family type IVb pilin [Myxococcota bacterium]|jgi:Flp pilus assembly pilin Flp|nr:Flp family type IVb pilin [Myxococcota bacterium]
MRNLIERFIKEEDGMEMVEWALVAGLVVIAAVGSWKVIGTNVKDIMGNLEQKTNDAKANMN